VNSAGTTIPADFFQFQKYFTTVDIPSPIVSSTAAHTKADEKLANWKRQNGI